MEGELHLATVPYSEDIWNPLIMPEPPPAEEDIKIPTPTMDVTHDREYILNTAEAGKVENGFARIDDMPQARYSKSPYEQLQDIHCTAR